MANIVYTKHELHDIDMNRAFFALENKGVHRPKYS